MVPKGLEWGGGNWEIKSPTNTKSIPQWELAAEVMPFMKTDDGAIPSIITAGDNKPSGIPTSLAKPIDNSKAVPGGESEGDSLMGLETLTKPYNSSDAADEQGKAAEEFKKTMYGAADNDGSSDEEGVSKTKKLQIRIRDKPTSSTVDVNKIKEATKRLGDGLSPPISRTKSLTGVSQDLGQSRQQPYPATCGPMINPKVSAPRDLFGTDSGYTLHWYYIQLLRPKVEVGGKVPPDQVNAPAADIGLPDGGIPPLSGEQPLPPESIGLLDGGVPPQYSDPAAKTGKPTPSASAPASVHPGQVPCGAAASICFKTGLAHLEQNQLPDSLSCFDEAFLGLTSFSGTG
ncbi:hypothetical protein PTKIN_Ptkin07bG0278200 [Pterospermum kingtungense]